VKRLLLITIVLAIVVCLVVTPVFAAGKSGQAGKSNIGLLYLYEKNPSDWTIVDGGSWGKMKYNLSGPTFDCVFNGHGLQPSGSYTLIYYGDATNNDVWPYATCIASGTADDEGDIHLAGSFDFGYGLSAAKIWLVLSSDVNCDGGVMTGWHPASYLFEHNLISYDDTDI